MMQESFKSVIFDWGGVLIDAPTIPLKQSCADQLGLSFDVFDSLFQPFVDAFYRGLIDEQVIWESIAAELNLSPPDYSLWGVAFEKTYVPKKAVFEMIHQLKDKGLKIGFLSNTEKAAVEFFHRQHYSFFDTTVFSCDEGLAKPGPEIYLLTAERLGISPQEAIFVDDRQDNIKGCEAVGMTGILFKSEEQLQAELVRLGLL